MGVWYSYKGKKYIADTPPYYYPDGVEWHDRLKKDLPQIKETLLSFLKLDGLDIKEYFNTTMVEGKRWETVSFMFWNLRNEKIINKGRDVFAYFKNVPGMVSLSVSILQPQTHIKGHNGDTDAIYRIHIPIFIPAGLPDCGITVGGVTRPWQENELIVFSDAHFHEAWNMTDQPRVIMIMDVIKEEFLPQTDNVCGNVLSALKYQRLRLKHKFIGKFPGWVKDIIRRTLKLSSNNIFK